MPPQDPAAPSRDRVAAALRLGLDYAAAPRHAPGIGRYVRELVRALLELEAGPDLQLLDIAASPPTLPRAALGLDGARRPRLHLRADLRRGAALALARVARVDRWLPGVEHFHQVLTPPWPVARARTSAAVSELGPRYGPAEEARGDFLRGLDQVHVFSEAARTELIARHDLDPRRVVHLPVGCDHWMRDLDAPPEPAARPYVLVLGATRHARSPLELLRAFGHWVEGGAPHELWFAGRRGDAEPELAALLEAAPWRERVRRVEAPDEAALPSLVAGAELLAHLSLEEWTPVTPLEAFAAGTAVLATPLAAFREILGGLAVWAPPPEAGARALADALQLAAALGRDPAAIRRRQDLAAPLTWLRHARRALQAWESLRSQ